MLFFTFSLQHLRQHLHQSLKIHAYLHLVVQTLNAKFVMAETLLVHVYQVLLALHPIVALSVSSIQIVLRTKLVSTRSALTHVLDRVVSMPTVKSFLMQSLVPVLLVSPEIRLFNALFNNVSQMLNFKPLCIHIPNPNFMSTIFKFFFLFSTLVSKSTYFFD